MTFLDQMRAAMIHRWRRVLVSLVVVILLGVAGVATGVYGLDWHDQLAIGVTRYTPLPAATVGWRVIPIHTFLEERQAIEHYRQAVPTSSTDGAAGVGAARVDQAALDKLVRQAATLALLERWGVTVSTSDVDQAFTAQILQAGDRALTTRTIAKLYGWTLAQYKAHVVRLAVARDKLRQQLSFDDRLNQTARRQAERVFALVQAGQQSFSELAKTYSEDAYAPNGGDLGFIKRGEQDEAIDDAAWSLPVGQTSDLIHTKFGWHIISVLGERQVEGEREVRVAQIFIAAPSVDAAITRYLQERRVFVWVRGLQWDRGAGRVTNS
ncbi:MAG: peptidylprolyl isomerase [Candidatus Kerfeldbacteria bacterium]|nr:peptidylprolyl isomerase [Candidatus Kerfeldbacteria bacterium]